MLTPFDKSIHIIYVELKNPVDTVVSLDDERVLIRSVECRSLGALGMPFALALECTLLKVILRYMD